MKNQLQEIESMITTHSAIGYAELGLSKLGDDEEYMQTMWGNGSDSMPRLFEKARAAYLQRYADAVNIYAGFLKNGKVFVLDKEQRLIAFLHKERKDGGSQWWVHYNPDNVDCLELSINSDYILDQSQRYEFSQDEEGLIKECDSLIGPTTSHPNPSPPDCRYKL